MTGDLDREWERELRAMRREGRIFTACFVVLIVVMVFLALAQAYGLARAS